MSPEQAMGAETVDARSDVYALGCVLYEMVNGTAPFEATTPQALVWKHAAEPPPALASKDGKVPLFLKRAVDQALAKEPGDRFQTARAFAEALTSETVVSSVRHRQRRRSRAVAALAALLLVVTAGWWLMSSMSGDRIERLAVLIPVNPAGSPEQEPIVQGMYHALLTELGQAGVPVIGGLQSMMRYRDTDLTVREIAAELGVDAIVEPSVFWAGDSVGIGVRLIDGESETALWSHTYDADTRNITTLYRQVTRAIAGELRLALSPEAERHLTSTKLVDPEAHQAYLLGKFHSGKLSRADLETAIEYFNLALEKDSAYAVAYAGLSWAWIAQRQMGNVPPNVATPLAIETAQRALALDSLLAEGHHALAIAEGWSDWAWEEAERGLKLAIELNPRYGDARADYSHLLLVLKRPVEAEAQADTALAIDPLDTKFLGFRGVIYMFTGQRDKGFADFERLLRTSPNNPAAHTVLASAYHDLKDYDKAVQHLTAGLTGRGMNAFAQALQADVATNGYHSAMLATADRLAQVAEATFVPATVLASLYAYAGAGDEALTWLEVGLRNHNPNMPYIGVNGLFGFVEKDPRFQQLLMDMRLPWAMGR
jgi:TolB-like protein/Tfp pilus assembly protein PilF